MPKIRMGGHFAGGFSQGLNQAREQNRADRAQGLQEKNAEFTKQKQLYDTGLKQIDQMGEQLAVMKAQNPNSQAVKMTEKAVAQMATQLNTLGKTIGLGENPALSTISMRPDALTMSKLKGKMAGAEVGSQAEALSAIPGADKSAVMQGLGLQNAPVKPSDFDKKLAMFESDPQKYSQFMTADNAPKDTRTEYDKTVQSYMSAVQSGDKELINLYEQRLKKMQASDTFDARSVTAPGKKSLAESTDSARDIANELELLSSTLDDIKGTKGATGVSGFLVDKYGGYVEQVFGASGDKALKSAGLDTGKISDVRAKATVLMARQIDDITGEESGRFTEAERQLAIDAQKALKPGASKQQIIGAFNALQGVMMQASVREAFAISDAGGFDLGTDEGINELGASLVKLGYTPDQTEDILYGVLKRKGVVE
jgi:hypothetical protein